MFPRIDKGPIEYTLTIGTAYNRDQQRDCVRFTFETSEEFSHFQYRIAIDEEISGNVLSFRLKGLKTMGLTLPGVGRARSSVDLFDLNGEYLVQVSKPGDVMNSFTMKINRNKPRIVEDVHDDQPFLVVTTPSVQAA
jgi:hypothetical protein